MQGIRELLDGLSRLDTIEINDSHHHYISLSQLNAWIKECAAPFSRGVLLDYGCGGQPYRRFFEQFVSTYVGADVAVAKGIFLDVELVIGKPAPLPDGSIDTILSTQTLEHVFDFQAYLLDCHRLLKDHGRLIISVPMQWRMHEKPYDYWRFTRFGLEKSLSLSGFQVKDLRPCGGVYSVIGQAYLEHLINRRKVPPIIVRLVNRLSLMLDKRYMDYEDTLGWLCLAERFDEKNDAEK